MYLHSFVNLESGKYHDNQQEFRVHERIIISINTRKLKSCLTLFWVKKIRWKKIYCSDPV
jgi:hypothetical protein